MDLDLFRQVVLRAGPVAQLLGVRLRPVVLLCLGGGKTAQVKDEKKDGEHTTTISVRERREKGVRLSRFKDEESVHLFVPDDLELKRLGLVLFHLLGEMNQHFLDLLADVIHNR